MGMTLEQIQRLYPVTVIDTITEDSKVELLTLGFKVVSPLFYGLSLLINLPIEHLWAHIERDYYFSRATSKTLAPVYKTSLDALFEKYLSEVTVEEVEAYIYAGVEVITYSIIVHTIQHRFFKKWTDLYNLLYSQEYSPLDSYSETEKRIADDTDTKTYDITDGKTGENTDVLTLNTQTDENGKVGTSETTTRSVESDNNVYGFNSSTPVGDTASTDTISESVVGEADNNTRESTRLRTGTESKAIGINETLKKTGTESIKYGKDETVTRSGRREAGADLLTKELSFRSKQILTDIILDDIISVTTSPLYL